MLILILIDVQSSQKAVFSFEKGSDRQNHSSSGFHHPVKIPPAKFQSPTMGGGGGGLTPTPTPYRYLENPETKKHQLKKLTIKQATYIIYAILNRQVTAQIQE